MQQTREHRQRGIQPRSSLASLRAALGTLPLLATLGCGSLGRLPTHSSPLPTTALAEREAGTSQNSPTTASPTTTSPTTPHSSISPRQPDVIPVSYEEPQRPQVENAKVRSISDTQPVDALPASHVASASCQICNDPAYSTTGGCSCGSSQVMHDVRNAQEYIFDGGDQQPAVVIKKDWSAVGIEPTDTVVYYQTQAGTVCVRPSNRVAIYAPRFGAVRQVSGLQLSARSVGTERILAPVATARFDEANLASSLVQPVAPHGEEQVRLIDAFQEHTQGTPMEQVVPPLRMSDARVPFEWIDMFGTGQITDEELVVIGHVLENARTWFVPEALQIEISGQSAALARKTMQAQDIYVYELPDNCAMRVCKAASHTIANSGDIVNFTIRFDNAGVKPLQKAVIMDSLSPRLSYIEGSQQCSIDARFTAEPNEVGSMILKWEVEAAIDPQDGGVISFDCRVR